MRWLIDAMNVIGSRPDGWWRDRERARCGAGRQVRAWADDEPVTVVLDTGPDDLLGTVGRRDRRARARGAGATPPTTRSCGSCEADPDALVVTSDADARRARARAGRRGRGRGHVPAAARVVAVSDEGLRAERREDALGGRRGRRDPRLRALLPPARGGRDRADARGLDRAGDRPARVRRAAVRRRRRARGAAEGDRAAAQRRARHEHGADGREVAARGQGRAELPGHHRPPGAGAARGARRPAAARADGLLLHPRGLAGGARASTPTSTSACRSTSSRTRSRSCSSTT